MISISASAPGKIVLCGEYVVLDGAPALGVALNRRAVVTVCENNASYHRITSPGYADGIFSFQVNERLEFAWLADGSSVPDFSLLEQVWRASVTDPSTMLDLVLDTRSFVAATGAQKLGLGSSAALTVALAAALAAMQQRGVDLDAMITSHRRFQNGHGSGLDIAVAQCGGVVEYRMASPVPVQCNDDSTAADSDAVTQLKYPGGFVEGHSDAVACVSPHGSFAQGRKAGTYVKPHGWPNDLAYAILWSGTAASTTRQLVRFGVSAAHPESRKRLTKASANIIEAWAEADVAQIVALFAEYTVALGAFDAAHDLGIFAAGHAELVQVADKHGAVYKPCGAGGGDVGIVLSTNTLSISSFVDEAIARGFQPLDLCIDDAGLRLGEAEVARKK